MKILRVFNNNVVLARDELGREVVLTGRGVGFQKRPGSPVSQETIARRFVPADNPASVGQIIADIPPERLRLVETLFARAVADLGSRLPPLTLVALADHIHQAVERVRRGEIMDYPLRAEVAHLHPQELAVAERMLGELNEHLDVPLPAGEAVALTMHLFHAVTGSPTMAATYEQSGLIRQVFALLADSYGPAFDPASIDAARFAAHLRYFFARARSGAQLDGDEGPVGAAMRAGSPAAYTLAQRIRALLELRLGHPVSEEEVVYLSLHVARLETGMRRGRTT